MKLSQSLFLLSTLLLFSACKKEVVDDSNTDNNLIQETMDPNMAKTTIKLNTGIQYVGDVRGDYSGTLSNYSWTLDYRRRDGYEIDGSVFYPIEKNGRYPEKFLSKKNIRQQIHTTNGVRR